MASIMIIMSAITPFYVNYIRKTMSMCCALGEVLNSSFGIFLAILERSTTDFVQNDRESKRMTGDLK